MKRISSIALMFLLAATMPLVAQNFFSGSFNAVFTSVEDGEQTVVQVIASPERLLLSGLGDVAPGSRPASMPGMDAERLLIRMDMQDFIFLSDKPTALRMQSQEIAAAMNLMAGFQQQSTPRTDQAVDIRETRETRRINGYNARKWVVTSSDGNGAVHVWVSEEFRVNWGMFASAWKMMTANTGLSGIADMLAGGQTPLLAEGFDADGKLQFSAELTDIGRGVRAGSLEVPDGVRLMSLQDMILQQMRNQQ